MILYPNCKINLGLNIVGRRPDGYHDIETVFLPIPLTDRLEIDYSAENSLEINGQPLDCSTKDNLVVRVLEMLRHEGRDVPTVSIRLTKNIPSGAGLGGGSSDAAFMLKGLNEMFSLGLTDGQMQQRVGRLGADCPVFIRNIPVYAEGIGNEFAELSGEMSIKRYCLLPPVGSLLPPAAELLMPDVLKGYWLVLIKPDIHVSTREAYSRVHPHKSAESLKELIQLPVTQWRGRVVNDFEKSVFQSSPVLQGVRDQLYLLGADYAAMSGSGSTIYGLFPERPMLGDVFEEHFQWQVQL